MEVGRRHLDGERIGGFMETRRERRGDDIEHPVEAVIGLEEGAARFRRRDKAVAVKVGEDGKRLHDVADLLQLAVGHGAIDRRQRHHRVDQGIMLRNSFHRLVHVRASVWHAATYGLPSPARQAPERAGVDAAGPAS